MPYTTRHPSHRHSGLYPPSSWRRPRGRPPLRWADQLVTDTQMSLSDAVMESSRSFRDSTCPATQALTSKQCFSFGCSTSVRVQDTEYSEMTKLSMTAMSSEEGVSGLSIR